MSLTHPQHFDDGSLPKHVHKSDLGTIFIYENLLITEFNEGVNVSYTTGINILVDVLKHIGTKPFTVISNRINSYSVQPTDYKVLEKVPNLKGIAIVAKDAMSSANAMLEAKFFSKAFAVFNDIKSAREWSQGLVSSDFTASK